MPDLMTSPEIQQQASTPAPSRREQKPPKRNTGLLVLIFLCSLASLAVSCLALWMGIRFYWVEEEIPEPSIEIVAEVEAIEGVDFLTFNGYQVPILEELAVNTYDLEAFSQEEGIIRYEDAKMGIDVSQYQGEIDWQAVADFGVEFAIVRLGYRGYGTTGTIKLDDYFHQNMEGAQAAGIDVGVYFFSQATSVWEVQEEAYFVLDNLEGYQLQLPVVFDWEFIDHSYSAHTTGMSGRSITLYTQVFCHEIASEGYQPAVYFNQTLGYLYMDLDELIDYPFWLASYRDTPNFHYHFDIWQYSDSGRVDGIEGDVDLNLMFTDLTI